MKKALKIILLLLFVATVAIAIFYRQTLRGLKVLAPARFGMQQLSLGIFVDPAMPESMQRQLLDAVSAAEARTIAFYGGLESAPRIIACSTEACFKKFGGFDSKGKAYGARAILLSPRGLSDGILSHEMSHVELFKRVGLRGYLKIPQWFDDGLAVLVSQYKPHGRAAWKTATKKHGFVPGLTELASLSGWIKISKIDAALSYGTAGEEVSRWYQKAGSVGLKRLIEQISARKVFLQNYLAAANIKQTFLSMARRQL